MYNSVHVKSSPTLAAVVKRAFPRYRKHTMLIIEAEGVTPSGTCWDGGSRSGYLLTDLRGLDPRHVTAPSAPPQFGGGQAEDYRHTLADNELIWEAGVFRGKTAHLKLFGTKAALTALGLEWAL